VLNGMLPYQVAKHNKQKIEQLRERIIVFVIPDVPNTGEQRNEIRFPFQGTITNVTASCSQAGLQDTKMKVQKISLEDLEAGGDWQEAVSNIVLSPNKRTNNSNPITVKESVVNEDDFFRIFIESAGEQVKDMTINVVIEVTL
jgi:hypothetical protein